MISKPGRQTFAVRRGSQFGYGLVEVVIGVGILAVALLGVGGLNLQLMKQQRQSSSLLQLSVFQSNLVTLIRNDRAWSESVQKNASMACLKNHSPCTVGGQPIQNQPFALYDGSSAAAAYYDATRTTSGLSELAVPCDSFSNNGSDDCPFRFELQWSAVCDPASCTDPLVKVKGSLRYKPGARTQIVNPATYSVPEIVRSGN